MLETSLKNIVGKQKTEEHVLKQPNDAKVEDSKSENIDILNLFDDSNQKREGWELDVVYSPAPQDAITSLPPDFKIMSEQDIYVLEQYLANKYRSDFRLFRGHESKGYHIESTLTRLLRGKGLSEQAMANVEKKCFDMFCKEVNHAEWLKHKTETTDDDLFMMSIARHLGLPCRLIDVTASLSAAVWFAVNNPKHYHEDGHVVLIVLDKGKIRGSQCSPFQSHGVHHAHESFKADDLDELPLGEQRRLVQNGHFVWVGNDSLAKEEEAITKFASHVERFTIPSFAKISLAADLYRDVYSGCAYGSTIAKIHYIMENYTVSNILSENNQQL